MRDSELVLFITRVERDDVFIAEARREVEAAEQELLRMIEQIRAVKNG
jgi:hypothetical protein